MAEQMIFKRYEMKYMLSKAQFEKLKIEMDKHMIPDEHGKSTNCSLYFDTPSFLLIRRSMEGPLYKEKLRIRSYGVANKESTVFIELKKKYEGVTYKRRIAMKQEAAKRYLLHGKKFEDGQIVREIDYCFKHYEKLAPAMLLTYDRQAFYDKNDHEFRMTFDENILWRDYDLSLEKGIYGKPLLKEDQVLLEIKVAAAIPRWLVEFMTANKIYRTSFSKYANAYREMYKNNKKQKTKVNEKSGGLKKYA